jgi:hypothetical protein
MSLQELDKEDGFVKDTRPGKEYLESKPYEDASSLLCTELKKFGFDETKQSKFPYGSSAPPVLGSFKYTIDYFNDQYKVKRWKAPTGKPFIGGAKKPFTQYSPANVIFETVKNFNSIISDIPATSDKHWRVINAFVLKNEEGNDIPYICAELLEKVK